MTSHTPVYPVERHSPKAPPFDFISNHGMEAIPRSFLSPENRERIISPNSGQELFDSLPTLVSLWHNLHSISFHLKMHLHYFPPHRWRVKFQRRIVSPVAPSPWKLWRPRQLLLELRVHLRIDDWDPIPKLKNNLNIAVILSCNFIDFLFCLEEAFKKF